MNITLDHIESLSAKVKTFWFRPEKPYHYVAGQFAELYLPHGDPDKRGTKRWFTLSSSPTEALLGITIDFAAKKGSSFKQTLLCLQPGQSVQLSESLGDFVLPKDPSLPLVFIVGGIGITPVRSMVKELTDQHKKRDIQLFYSVHTEKELHFNKLFTVFGSHYTPIVQRPTAAWRGKTGHITPQNILEYAPQSDQALIYISGPEYMAEALYETLKKSGVQKHRLILDFFPGYNEA